MRRRAARCVGRPLTAEALGEKDGAAKLKAIVKDIYKADEFTNQLAERAEKAAAKAA